MGLSRILRASIGTCLTDRTALMSSKVKTSDDILDEVLAEFGSEMIELTAEEGREAFDRSARFTLGISGEEFLRRWGEGEWKNDIDQPGVITMYGLLPLVGRED